MKNFFTKKTTKILMGMFFGFVLMSPFFVEASHIFFKYDEKLNTAQNLEKTGHPELYEAIMAEMKKSGYNKSAYESIYMKILSGSENKENKQQLKNNESNENFTFTLLQPLPTESGKLLTENVTLKEYLTWAYKFVLALTGFLAVMMIVIGGVEYVISGANESMRGEAHSRIWGAITGLILALVAYLVLYTINPSLVNFEDNWFFKPRNIQTQNQTQNSKTTQTNSNINQGVQKMNDLKFDEKVMQDSNVSNTGSSNSKDETKIKEAGVSNFEIKKTISPHE